MSIIPLHALDGLLKEYGYATVFLGVLLESTGLPLPGESLMIAAAIYTATTHHLNIFALVPVAAAGAISGDQIGYFIGRSIGFRVLARWGRKLGLTEERLDLGRYLFRRYGGRVVFLGRFVAILRTFVALLAGANRMPWHTFLIWNALGGIGWVSLYGFGAYLLGDAVKRISGPAGIALAVAGAAVLGATFLFVKRNETGLMDEARRDMQHSDGGSAVGARRRELRRVARIHTSTADGAKADRRDASAEEREDSQQPGQAGHVNQKHFRPDQTGEIERSQPHQVLVQPNSGDHQGDAVGEPRAGPRP